MKIWTLGILTAALLGACTKPDTSDTTAITNRPQNYDRLIAIVKLSEPALLETAAVGDGGVNVIDQDRLQALNDEQEKAISELLALSDQIEVLNRYRLVLNGIAILAPRELEAQLRKSASTSYIEWEQSFDRQPMPQDEEADTEVSTSFETTSVDFIGATAAHELGFKGSGVSVGVIDTGIDYTHAMFGGAGTIEAYDSNNPDFTEGDFPTAKVVGGIDLVGSDYDASSPQFNRHIPKPDNDPLDEQGHGTHVAGTVGGIGDGVNTYTGVAPDADLYAIKVFGKDGSTGDSVIIAALEYAADPNGDLILDDQLDVINLSLGSGYGTPHVLYSEAMKNLVMSGTASIASAGNSGHTGYIVGSPGTTSEAISIAASIDNMDHNWKFDASRLTFADGTTALVEAISAAFAKPLDESLDVTGKLVFAGLGAEPFDDAMRALVQGNVAFMDRGQVAFCTKAQNALDAGAIAFVVANNDATDPFVMGGDCTIQTIPGIMISKSMGDRIKASHSAGDVTVTFVSGEKIEKPELIDTLTGFSSRGPRSIDALIKPEVAAPGYNIVSAKMGAGQLGTRLNGTSMAAPHVAGMAALLKQKFPTLDPMSFKSVVVNSAKSISDAAGSVYPIAQQGAGRVQVLAALQASIAVLPATVSLGTLLVEESKTVRKTVSIKNMSDSAKTVKLILSSGAGIALTGPDQLQLAAGETATATIKAKLTPEFSDASAIELEGLVEVAEGDVTLARIPVLAVARKAARIKSSRLLVQATSNADAEGAVTNLKIQNSGKTSGSAFPFNLLARDERKPGNAANPSRNGICDLQAVGYRVTKQAGDSGEKSLLEFGVKLYNPVTTWHLCEVSIQIDGDGDGVTDQELLGTYAQTLTDNRAHNNLFFSALTDGEQMRTIRATYEANWPDQESVDYSPAIIDTQDFDFFDHSTVAIVKADLSLLKRDASGNLRIKVAVLADQSTPEADDFLAKQESKWHTLKLDSAGIAFTELPVRVDVAAGSEQSIEFVKGGASGKLLLLMPHNTSTSSISSSDQQAKILSPIFQP